MSVNKCIVDGDISTSSYSSLNDIISSLTSRIELLESGGNTSNITDLQTKTQNQSATQLQTIFSGDIITTGNITVPTINGIRWNAGLYTETNTASYGPGAITETQFIGNTNAFTVKTGSRTISANSLTVGDCIAIKCGGSINKTENKQDETIIILLKTNIDTTPITLGSWVIVLKGALSSVPYDFEVEMVVRSFSATNATIQTNGIFSHPNALGDYRAFGSNTTQTINRTINNTLTLTIQSNLGNNTTTSVFNPSQTIITKLF